MGAKRGNVWLAVAGLVIAESGKWLVVKKNYGGLKGKWSLPAGFVEEGETVDEAVLREVREETGVSCKVEGLVGVRTGVIKDQISDNMLIFLLKPESETVAVQDSELSDARFASPEELLADPDSSVLIEYFLKLGLSAPKPVHEGINPGQQFGYTAYKLFY